MQTYTLRFNFLLAAMCFVTSTHAAQSIDVDSKLIAECEFAYSYVGQLMQLNNNEGAAKNMFFRSTLMTTTNFFRNAQAQTIPGWKTEQLKKLRAPLKQKFDTNPNEALRQAATCDAQTSELVRRETNSNKSLWGKSFHELHTELFRGMLLKLGLI